MKPDPNKFEDSATSRGKTADRAKTGSGAGEGRGLRAALGRFATGVAIVTALTDDRPPVGMTINSFASVSLSPPLVSWCLDRSASSHDAFAGARQFAVTVLAEEQSGLAMRFARRGADKFRDIEVRRDSPPVIPGGCAWFVCDSHCTIPLGDHLMLIGRVVEFGARPGRPLVFADGRFQDMSRPSERAAA
jgi:unspecific monooxygenase